MSLIEENYDIDVLTEEAVTFYNSLLRFLH